MEGHESRHGIAREGKYGHATPRRGALRRAGFLADLAEPGVRRGSEDLVNNVEGTGGHATGGDDEIDPGSGERIELRRERLG